MMAGGSAMVMSWARPFRRAAIVFAGLVAMGAQSSAAPATELIAARVLSVSDDGTTAIINRGRSEKIVPGSACVIRPNRGTDSADIEWDVVFAKGIIQDVAEDRSTVKITETRQPLQARDYCQVETSLPGSLFESDLGRLASLDVTVMDRTGTRPLYSLKELAADASPRAIEALTKRIFEEIRTPPADLIRETFGTEPVRTGRFAGKALAEVLPLATFED